MPNKHKLICADWLDGIQIAGDDYYACAFADPPDNTGMEYDGYSDNLPAEEYYNLLSNWVRKLVQVAGITWFSYNSRWAAEVGTIVNFLCLSIPELEKKHCVQTFTFGQYNSHDLSNGHRPIWRLRWPDAPLYPDQIRIESERQRIGDPRANPDGKVPSDVFDFPRVVGNAKQRRSWHKTQLHEGLVKRCIELSTAKGDLVLDPFGGTGTVLRVCKKVDRASTTFEISQNYCKRIARENCLRRIEMNSPSAFLRCRSCRGRIVQSVSKYYATCEEGCNKLIPHQELSPTYASW